MYVHIYIYSYSREQLIALKIVYALDVQDESLLFFGLLFQMSNSSNFKCIHLLFDYFYEHARIKVISKLTYTEHKTSIALHLAANYGVFLCSPRLYLFKNIVKTVILIVIVVLNIL